MQALLKVWDAVDGRKTYLIALVTAVLNLAVACNWVSPEHLTQINVVLGALGVGAIRHAMEK